MIKTFVSNSFARFAGLRLVLLSPTAYAVGYRSAARFASFVVVLLTLVALTTCSTHHGEEVDTTAIPEVTVAKVQRVRLQTKIVVNGNLAGLPNRDAKLAPLVPGRIARVLVTEGDRVSAGQVLAELENAQLKDQERQAEAAVAQAEANLENARASAKRNENLLQRGIAARKEVEDARTQLAVSEAAHRQASAAFSVAKSQLGRAEIRAPFAGTVVRRFLGVGDQVDGSGGQPVVEVAAIEALELLGTVPANRLNDIKIGETFKFTTDAAPGATFEARVVAALPAVDPATNNGTVRVRIQNPKRLLKLGQYLSLELPSKESSPRLVVPKQAIYPGESGEPHVYVVKGEEADMVPVVVGAQTGEQAEIISGVSDGDSVIVNGGYGLPEKSKVRVKGSTAQ